MRRLVLVRHGESVSNAESRVQGHQCKGLSSLGHAQARLTAAALALAYPDAVLASSDLQRTVETMAPFEAEFGRPARRDPDLRERFFGSWEGMLRDEVAADDPGRWQRWRDGDDVIAEVGGESTPQLGDRVVGAYARLLEEVPSGGVAIAVTHGGAIHFGIHHWLELEPWTLGGVANASVTELVIRDAGETKGRTVALDRWNEVAHLPVELRTAWKSRTPEPDAAKVAP